jgi:hypothetical protein
MIFVILHPKAHFLLLPAHLIQKKISLPMRRILTIALTAALPALPNIASAHAGHSEFPADHILHYLATPAHAMPLLMAAVLIVVTAVAIRKELAVRKIRNRKD